MCVELRPVVLSNLSRVVLRPASAAHDIEAVPSQSQDLKEFDRACNAECLYCTGLKHLATSI